MKPEKETHLEGSTAETLRTTFLIRVIEPVDPARAEAHPLDFSIDYDNWVLVTCISNSPDSDSQPPNIQETLAKLL